MDTIRVETMGLENGNVAQRFCFQCINTRTPAFREGIETWKAALPVAKIHVRFLIAELLTGGNPAQDLFNILGLSGNECRVLRTVQPFRGSPDFQR